MASSTDHIKAPIYVDAPFTAKFPLPAGTPCACCIPLPKIRGIPKGSWPLPFEEARDLLKQLEGNWKITPLDTKGMNVTYEEVMVRDDYYIMSGGMHNTTVHHHGHNGHPGRSHRVAVANRTYKEHFHFFRGPNEEIYLDYIGSMLTKMDIAGGEVEMNNGLGISMLWQRGWKKDGLPPPQQQMGGVVVAAEPVVVQATVVGASNVAGNQAEPPNPKTPEERRIMAKALKENTPLQGLVSLDESRTERFIDTAWKEEVKAGTNVYNEGDPASFLYIVKSGKFDIIVKKHGRVAQLNPGVSFGERGLIDAAARAATIKAVVDSELWVID
ncbi:Pka-R1, partial [Symbiodinium microadriaticum]